jgi:hypothetical protein
LVSASWLYFQMPVRPDLADLQPPGRANGRLRASLATGKAVAFGVLDMEQPDRATALRRRMIREWYPGRSLNKKGNVLEVEQAPVKGEPAPGTVALVPFMITSAQKANLRELGYVDEAIKEMTPQEALDTIELMS